MFQERLCWENLFHLYLQCFLLQDNICDVLRDLVQSVRFKKREKRPRYQIAQRITFNPSSEISFNFGFHVEIPTRVTVGREYILVYQILIWKGYVHTKS